MQFIVFPGKTIGTKLPVQKTTWYNEEFFKALIELKINKNIHYYKNKKSYVLSNADTRNSVHVTVVGKNKEDIRIDYYESYTCSKTLLMLKKLIRHINVSKNDLMSLKRLSLDVAKYLTIDTSTIIKIPIHQTQQDNIFCYVIKSIEVIKEQDNNKYIIKTNNFLMSEIIIQKDIFIGEPTAFDVVIVKDNKHVCIDRADFYKHYKIML
jgi:hypothetical protein